MRYRFWGVVLAESIDDALAQLGSHFTAVAVDVNAHTDDGVVEVTVEPDEPIPAATGDAVSGPADGWLESLRQGPEAESGSLAQREEP